MDKAKAKKISSIVLSVLMYVFIAICLITVFMTVMSKKDTDGAAEIFGYQMRVVASDSMAKSEHTDVSNFKIKDIPIRSMVFIDLIPDEPDKADEWYRSLKVGDVLTFRYVYTSKQVTITHRIISISENAGGGFTIKLAGDNKNSEDGALTQVIDTSIPNNTNYVIGKVTGQSKMFGAVMSFMMQPVGIVLIIILPCALIIVFEVVKISKIFLDEKKKREQEEQEKTQNELEELRKKLSDLEKIRQTPSGTVEGETNKGNGEETK